MSEAYISLVLRKPVSYAAWYHLKLGSLFFQKQDDRVRSLHGGSLVAAAAWAWHPAEAAAPGKGAQGTLSASLAAAARRAYIDSRTCLQMAILPLEELFKGLQGFKFAGLHHSEIRYCSYCGGAQHWVWANWKWFTFFFSEQNFISAWLKAFCSITIKCFTLLVWGLLL